MSVDLKKNQKVERHLRAEKVENICKQKRLRQKERGEKKRGRRRNKMQVT